MTGSIPEQMQRRQWTNLDLSYNKFTGMVDDFQSISFNSSNSSAYSLEVNRLSGHIPQSLTDAASVDILEGNLFTCNIYRESLPKEDPKYNQYTCGSNDANYVLYTWMSCVGVGLVAIIVGIAAEASHRASKGRILMLTWKMISLNEITPSVAGAGDVTVSVQHTLSCFMSDIRAFSTWLTVYIVLVAMITFIVLHQFFGNYENQYAWVVSVCFMHGLSPAVTVLVVVVFFMVFVMWQWERLLMRRESDDSDYSKGRNEQSLCDNKNDTSGVRSHLQSKHEGNTTLDNDISASGAGGGVNVWKQWCSKDVSFTLFSAFCKCRSRNGLQCRLCLCVCVQELHCDHCDASCIGCV